MRWVPRAAAAATLPDTSGLAIQDLLQGDPPSAERIQGFLDDHEIPLVEGPKVTFFFQGSADTVRLRHWIYGLSSSESFHRVPGTDLWYAVMEIPEGSRVEYQFEIIRGRDSEWILRPGRLSGGASLPQPGPCRHSSHHTVPARALQGEPPLPTAARTRRRRLPALFGPEDGVGQPDPPP
jgi:hypothetical protein